MFSFYGIIRVSGAGHWAPCLSCLHYAPLVVAAWKSESDRSILLWFFKDFTHTHTRTHTLQTLLCEVKENIFYCVSPCLAYPQLACRRVRLRSWPTNMARES